MGRAGAGAGDLVPARGGVHGDEMAAPGTAFAGQPGRRAGHRHPAADPGHRPPAAGGGPARRLVRTCLQPAAAVVRAGSRHRQRAGLAGAGLPAPQPARRPASSALSWTGCARGWTAPRQRRTRSPASGRCSTAPWASRSSSGCCPPTPSAWCAGARPGLLWLSGRLPCRTRRRSGRSWTRSPASGRNWPRSSAACTTRRCAPKRPSRYAAATSSSPRMVAARSSSPRPARALAPPGPAPAPRSSRAASSTAPTGRPASSPSRPSWSACSAVISAITAPRPDGRLFRGARGGMLSESVYGRAWHAARLAALGPGLAATPLARRPYDLRYAALSLWLNATGEPAEVAARAGEQRPRPLRGLPALHRRPARYRQPADRRRPRRRHAWLSSASRRGNERLCEPSAPPRTLSAICT